MPTQAIRFLGPVDETLTVDVFTLASDTAEQSNLTCTEATNRKGLYTTQNFTDTLAGRHYLVKKKDGTPFCCDFVVMANADGTYDSEGILFSPTMAGISVNTALVLSRLDASIITTTQLFSPVNQNGELLELIKETDYLAANGRALEWTFSTIAGITTLATGRFGVQNSAGQDVYVNTTGVVTEPTPGIFQVAFDIANTATGSLAAGAYDWSVEVIQSPYKITVARNRQIKSRVNIVEKYT